MSRVIQAGAYQQQTKQGRALLFESTPNCCQSETICCNSQQQTTHIDAQIHNSSLCIYKVEIGPVPVHVNFSSSM